MRRHILLFCWLPALLLSCGDPLVSGQYRGTPLLQVEGNLYATSEAVLEQTRDKDIKVTLFWAASRQQSLRDLSLIAEQGVLTEADLPARYRLTAFSPPQVEAAATDQTQWWIGLILLYEDSNHNGLWNGSGEPLVGGATRHVLVYATADWSPEELSPYLAVTGDQARLPAGYTLMKVSTDAICPAQGELLGLEVASADTLGRVDLALSLDPIALLPDVDCDAQPTDWDVPDPEALEPPPPDSADMGADQEDHEDEDDHHDLEDDDEPEEPEEPEDP